MAALKIGLFLASDPSKAGGIQAYVFNTAKEIEAAGHHVTVFGPKITRPLIYQFTNYIQVSHTIYINTPSGFQPRVNFPLIPQQKINMDVFHIHEPYVPFITGRLPFTAQAKIKIAGFHTGWNSSGSWVKFVAHSLPYLRFFYRNYYDGVTYASTFIKKNWEVLFDSSITQKIINNGVKTPHTSLLKHKHKLRVLYLARLVPRKGVMDFLNALLLIETSLLTNVEINIIGEGQEKYSALAFAKKYHQLTHINFLGELIGDKKEKYLHDSSIFVAPYRDEGFGLTILEALASGCAVVGYMNEAISEILVNYPAPELFGPQNDID